MNKRDLKKQQTRERILHEATELFTRQGILATSTIEIAEAASIAHGTLFVHFSTRDELIAEVVKGFWGRLAGRLQALVDGKRTVRSFLAAYLEGVAEHEEFYSRLIGEMPMLPPYARSTCFGIQSVISSQLTELAEAEASKGKLKKFRQDLLFNSWLGFIHHYILNRDLFVEKGKVCVERKSELLNHFMKMITT
jgi:AcrR family transcriptional regulator